MEDRWLSVEEIGTYSMAPPAYQGKVTDLLRH